MTTALSLYIQREGDIALPKFVILHGLFGSTPNFTSLAKALSTQFEVIRVDLRNHGRSPHASDMNYQVMAADVAATLVAEGINSATVLGHSMGGKVAMQLAADRPDLVSELVVADIAPKTYPNNSHSEVLTALNKLNLEQLGSRKAADEQLAVFLDDPMLRQFLLSNLVRAEQGFKWRINLAAISQNYPSIASAPLLGAAFDKPCLFICGGRSDYIQTDDYSLIARYFPTAVIVTIDDAGHWLHAEKPQQFLAQIQQFVATI